MFIVFLAYSLLTFWPRGAGATDAPGHTGHGRRAHSDHSTVTPSSRTARTDSNGECLKFAANQKKKVTGGGDPGAPVPRAAWACAAAGPCAGRGIDLSAWRSCPSLTMPGLLPAEPGAGLLHDLLTAGAWLLHGLDCLDARAGSNSVPRACSRAGVSRVGNWTPFARGDGAGTRCLLAFIEASPPTPQSPGPCAPAPKSPRPRLRRPRRMMETRLPVCCARRVILLEPQRSATARCSVLSPSKSTRERVASRTIRFAISSRYSWKPSVTARVSV